MSDRVQEIYPAQGASWKCEEGTGPARVFVHNVLLTACSGKKPCHLSERLSLWGVRFSVRGPFGTAARQTRTTVTEDWSQRLTELLETFLRIHADAGPT
jgi:hypothetical protein